MEHRRCDGHCCPVGPFFACVRPLPPWVCCIDTFIYRLDRRAPCSCVYHYVGFGCCNQEDGFFGRGLPHQCPCINELTLTYDQATGLWTITWEKGKPDPINGGCFTGANGYPNAKNSYTFAANEVQETPFQLHTVGATDNGFLCQVTYPFTGPMPM